jgi:hypothetical protein
MKKDATVHAIKKTLIEALDLNYTDSDIEQIVQDGVASLERDYTEGIEDCLSLFSEILGYVKAPKAFKIDNHNVIGKLAKSGDGTAVFGPMILHNLIYNTLKAINDTVPSFDRAKIERVQSIADGMEKPDAEGPEVLAFLKSEVMRQKPDLKLERAD